jgi:hypothetical protein
MTGLLHYIRTSPLLRGALVALLLGCVGVGVLGEWLVFKIIKSDIHREIENRIKLAAATESDLVIIKIPNLNPPKDFVFIEAGREFRYRGEMYDIVSQAVKNDTTYYHCIHDVRETALYANLNHKIYNEFTANPTHQKKYNELLKRIPDFYLPYTNSVLLGFTCYTQQPDAKQTAWVDVPPTIISPPPEL